MLSYCLKCRKHTGSINPRVSKTNNGKTMALLKYVALCAICGCKNSKFIKKQKASGILSNLDLMTQIRFHYWVIYCFRIIK